MQQDIERISKKFNFFKKKEDLSLIHKIDTAGILVMIFALWGLVFYGESPAPKKEISPYNMNYNSLSAPVSHLDVYTLHNAMTVETKLLEKDIVFFIMDIFFPHEATKEDSLVNYVKNVYKKDVYLDKNPPGVSSGFILNGKNKILFSRSKEENSIVVKGLTSIEVDNIVKELDKNQFIIQKFKQDETTDLKITEIKKNSAVSMQNNSAIVIDIQKEIEINNKKKDLESLKIEREVLAERLKIKELEEKLNR